MVFSQYRPHLFSPRLFYLVYLASVYSACAYLAFVYSARLCGHNLIRLPIRSLPIRPPSIRLFKNRPILIEIYVKFYGFCMVFSLLRDTVSNDIILHSGVSGYSTPHSWLCLFGPRHLAPLIQSPPIRSCLFGLRLFGLHVSVFRLLGF